MMEKLKYTKFKTLLISSFIKTGTDQAVRKTNVAKC